MRDYLNRWYVGAGDPILSQENLKAISGSRAPNGPLYQEIIDNFVISWYTSKEEVEKWRDKPFIIGLDASDMVDRDFTTAVAIDPKTLRTLFTFRCNSANITAIAAFFTKMMLIYKKAVLIPEAKSTGRTIIDAVADNLVTRGVSPFTRIFNYIVQNYNTNPTFRKMNFTDVNLYANGGKRHVGFMTTGKTRNELYKDTLQKAADISGNVVLDPTLIDELMSLEVKNGRIDHGDNKHDDMVISWLLAHWLIFYGANLRFYGLDISQIDNIKADNSASAEKVKEELELRDFYSKTKQKMDMTKDPIVKNALAQRLRVIQSKMSGEIKLSPISQEVSKRGGYELSSGKDVDKTSVDMDYGLYLFKGIMT